MATFTHVGKPITRVEGAGKVTGEAVYAADIQLPRMLHCKLLRSPFAHAKIKRIKTLNESACCDRCGVYLIVHRIGLITYPFQVPIAS